MGAYDIGPKIGIEGDKEFRDSIRNINAGMRTLKTEMEQVASQFDKNDKSTESLNAKNEVLTKQIELQKEKLKKLTEGLKDSAKEFGENDTKTLRWQATVNKANADLNNLERQLADNVSALDDFGDELDDATSRGGKFRTAIDGMGKGLKAVGKTTAKAAIGAVKGVGLAAGAAAAGVVALTESTREYRQDMSKFEQNVKNAGNDLGVMTKELAGLTALTGEADSSIEALSNIMASGFSDNEITSTIEALSGAIVKFPDTLKIESLADGLQETLATGQATGAFAELIERMGGDLDSFNESMSEATTEADKHRVALDWLAGSGLTEISEQYKEANKEMLSAAESQFEMNDSLADLAEVAEPAVAILKGGFADVLKNIVRILKGDKDATKGFTDSLSQLVGNSISEINKLMPMITSGLSALLPALVSGIEQIFPDVANAAVLVITVLAESLVGALPGVLPVLVTLIVTLITTLAQLFIDQGPLLIQTGIDALMMLIDGMVEALPMLMEMGITLILALIEALVGVLPELIPVAIEALVILAKGLIDALPLLIEMAPVIVSTLVSALIDNMPLLVDAAIEITTALLRMLVDNAPMIFEAGTEIIVQLIAGLVSMISELLSYIPSLYANISDEFNGMDWWSIGGDIIDGIGAGIKNAAGNLARSAKNAASNALQATKDFLGIKSPSRKFKEEVGDQIGAGMAQGILDSADKVSVAMDKVNRDMVDGFDVRDTNWPRRGSGGSGDTYVETKLYLDGKQITRSTSKNQYKRNKSKSRSLGVVPK